MADEKKIAIVDDEISFLDIFGKVLENHGFEVGKFASGREALLKIPGGNFDLLLLDVSMPEMDGLALLANLERDMGPRMPKAALLTNLEEVSGMALNRDFATAVGGRDYIKKTDDLDVIVRKVKEIIAA